MSDLPQISVILPVYNGERYLAEAIESALGQTYLQRELIVVDDGSSDHSALITQRYAGVCLLSQPHSGVSIARNLGVEAATGDFLAFLDSDDLWLPQKLCCQIAAFQTHPELDMAFGHVDEFYSPDVASNGTVKMRHCNRGVPGYIPSTLMIRKSSFYKAGLFEPQWQIAQFFDWYVHAQEKGLRSYLIPEVITKRRLHGGNLGIRQHQEQTEYVKIAKALLDRRRNARRDASK